MLRKATRPQVRAAHEFGPDRAGAGDRLDRRIERNSCSSDHATKQALGLSELFLGVIVIAIIGNAAEHAAAIFFAAEDKMDLSLAIAIGSSVQIALLVAPLLVFYSWMIHKPMSLLFVPLEMTGIALAVLVLMDMISSDGETTWFEGVQLLAVYVILAVAFYLVPTPVH